MIVDFGTCSLCTAIFSSKDGLFEAKSSCVDMYSGGNQLDDCLMKHCVKFIREKFNIDISRSSGRKKKLKQACESAKRTLSSSNEAR